MILSALGSESQTPAQVNWRSPRPYPSGGSRTRPTGAHAAGRYAADVTDPTPSRPPVRGSQRAAAALTLVEALVLLGFTVFFVVEIVSGASESVATASTLGVLSLCFSAGFGALAVGWSRGSTWPRTPTILLNALLVPVAWSLHDAERTDLALPIGAVAVATIVAAVAAPGRRADVS